VQAAIKHMRSCFAWGNAKLWNTLRKAGHQIFMASTRRVVQELLANNEIKSIRFRKDTDALKWRRSVHRRIR